MKLSYTDIPNELIPMEAEMIAQRKKVAELKNTAGKEVELGQELVALANIDARINTIKSRLMVNPNKSA